MESIRGYLFWRFTCRKFGDLVGGCGLDWRWTKRLTDPSAEIELTPESYLRFRRALGKLLWMAAGETRTILNCSCHSSDPSRQLQWLALKPRFVLSLDTYMGI